MIQGSVTLGEVLTKVKRILQEEIGSSGVRWTTEELLSWLNDAYRAVFGLNPVICAERAEFICQEGAYQRLNDETSYLLEVIRNTTEGALIPLPLPVSEADMRPLIRMRAKEPISTDIEYWMPDALARFRFTVFPPARAGTRLEVYKASLPMPHQYSGGANNDYSAEPIRVRDQYAPALIDYVLYRAFSKDAEAGANLNRASLHYQSFIALVGAGAPRQQGRGG